MSHCPIITESEGTQSVVQSDEIYLIVLARSVWSHSLTFGPNFSMTVKNYLRSSDWVWHVRLQLITSDYYFPLTQVLRLAQFSSDFPPNPPIGIIFWSVGSRDANFRDWHSANLLVLLFIVLSVQNFVALKKLCVKCLYCHMLSIGVSKVMLIINFSCSLWVDDKLY